ncbi:MAG: hypothetical protein M1828_000682 [Chrysothrix sp. TS-e1954]|nr:MAG: hypothetical protein M1828_000682 [Chrysothrix sp. TS-e1954]
MSAFDLDDLDMPATSSAALIRTSHASTGGYQRSAQSPRNGFLKLAQVFVAVLSHFSFTSAAPILVDATLEDAPKTAGDPQLWIYLGTAMALVLLGGAFAGLTIALMGQDGLTLQVLATSGDKSEKKNAAKVLRLLKRGKHWVLVTLLVGNVITNETLPIVLDRSIGGGYAAAISSTVLVIIFGEIVPQSICVRFGLPIGAWCANFVLLLMFIFAPITWPIAKLLDWLLGEDHGTTYKKAGLKTLVTLHKTMGEVGSERLNEDEVSIISGVLDLKEKSVGSIMTPMNDVFTLSADAILDEKMMDVIGREGYSRIPIHEPKNDRDFVGMLLVKMLITYDPEDARKVSDFSLATLPETRPETSCLDIINFFQEGKSHMIMVSDFPGNTYGALGVVTLEDVIEELIGEEIIDESDVFVDVHKAIRRMAPAPTHRARPLDDKNIDGAARRDSTASNSVPQDQIKDGEDTASTTDKAGKPANFLVRRKSSTGSNHEDIETISTRGYTPQIRQQLRNLGPSNAASRPKSTRVNTVKIKPAVSTIPEATTLPKGMDAPPKRGDITTPPPTSAQGGIGHGLVSPNKDASDGVQAVHSTYGSLGNSDTLRGRSGSRVNGENETSQSRTSPSDNRRKSPERGSLRREESQSTVGELRSPSPRSPNQRRGTARSGSLTEQFVDTGKVKKLVLEATSSSDDPDGEGVSASMRGGSHDGAEDIQNDYEGQPRAKPGEVVLEGSGGKKKRRKRGGKKKGKSEDGTEGPKDDENTPLLERGAR